MDKLLNLIGRDTSLFRADIQRLEHEITDIVRNSRFLVIGGAGTIGKATCLQIFRRDPKVLHVVDISENNLVELVRDIRSSFGYGKGDFKTFAIDVGSTEFTALFQESNGYDYVFNLSALKHVRSEKDPYTLMRMLQVNILNNITICNLAKRSEIKNLFCVSTDKAANPVNLMGASKRVMEHVLAMSSNHLNVSMARFANVAFSDGSLLHGFNQRYLLRQPLAAPKDILRYFITPEESGQLCLLAGLYGSNLDIFIPKGIASFQPQKFSDIALRLVKQWGYTPKICNDEVTARFEVDKSISRGQWPCYFFNSETTGEKEIEEFFMEHEILQSDRFDTIDVVKSLRQKDENDVQAFIDGIEELKNRSTWEKADILRLFKELLPELNHKDTGKYLDDRM